MTVTDTSPAGLARGLGAGKPSAPAPRGRAGDPGAHAFLEGAQQSQRAAESLNELSAKLVALTDRYRVAA